MTRGSYRNVLRRNMACNSSENKFSQAGWTERFVNGKLIAAGQHPERKEKYGAHEFKHQIDCESHNPERQEQEPDQGIKKKYQKRQWPADHQQHAPEND